MQHAIQILLGGVGVLAGGLCYLVFFKYKEKEVEGTATPRLILMAELLVLATILPITGFGIMVKAVLHMWA